MKLQIITLGCSKNRVDSEHILARAAACGVEIVSENASFEDARPDIVALNTCGFIQDAKTESIEAIFSALEAKKRGFVGKVLVFGCLSQRYRKELQEEIPEVDGFLGSFDAENLLAAMGLKNDDGLYYRRLLTTPPHYAYLKISEGCNRTCSYCAIPAIRGAHISVPMEKLVREAEELAGLGVKELIVVAQDTTYYGLDLYKKRMLAPLLAKLADIKGIEWIRVHYSYPDSFPEDVLEIMACCYKMCKYIDIPLQHASSKVLSAMRRSVDGEQTRALIEKFRKEVPGVVLRTTMIVGHPGEGVKEFRELLDFVKTYRFERLGAFQYSEEDGTYGALHLKDTVSKRVKQQRYDTLMELQSGISLDFNLSRVGSDCRLIVDSVSDECLVALSHIDSPEVDGEIFVNKIQGINPGDFINARITEADCYDLRASITR